MYVHIYIYRYIYTCKMYALYYVYIYGRMHGCKHAQETDDAGAIAWTARAGSYRRLSFARRFSVRAHIPMLYIYIHINLLLCVNK